MNYFIIGLVVLGGVLLMWIVGNAIHEKSESMREDKHLSKATKGRGSINRKSRTNSGCSENRQSDNISKTRLNREFNENSQFRVNSRFVVPQDLIDELKALSVHGKKFEAIKKYRMVTGASLQESKDFVNSLED
ncbi:hypothetical protein SAMN02745196_01154 [Clostridium collagenovorans DSM 3089]|uniref:Ribosomal protein L7/L12 C-terminal domain-containing protein n=1 Tax=Clostridium collagenovorans DSM 3089 TaxID=1121306 RepID=A0A1M5V7N8_9CLOT|nr:hypothetical protein [Clostridium collagenovorans]SHH71231.1 hypothetical protein SAMN02745196_01154 [Clostridium collagenovorans DSM 3089]